MVRNNIIITVAGEGGAGKTSLINTLVREPIPQAYVATRQTTTHQAIATTRNHGEVDVTLKDTSGQEVVGGRGTYIQSPFTGADGVVLVAEHGALRGSMATCEEIHDALIANQFREPVIVVANKLDQRLRANAHRRIKLPSQRALPFWGTRCKTLDDETPPEARTGGHYDVHARAAVEEAAVSFYAPWEYLFAQKFGWNNVEIITMTRSQP